MAKLSYVLAGDYADYDLTCGKGFGTTALCILTKGKIRVTDRVDINKQTVKSYNIVDSSSKNEFSLSYGVHGKGTSHIVDIKFKDGTKALVSFDKIGFEAFLSVMY